MGGPLRPPTTTPSGALKGRGRAAPSGAADRSSALPPRPGSQGGRPASYQHDDPPDAEHDPAGGHLRPAAQQRSHGPADTRSPRPTDRRPAADSAAAGCPWQVTRGAPPLARRSGGRRRFAGLPCAGKRWTRPRGGAGPQRRRVGGCARSAPFRQARGAAGADRQRAPLEPGRKAGAGKKQRIPLLASHGTVRKSRRLQIPPPAHFPWGREQAAASPPRQERRRGSRPPQQPRRGSRAPGENFIELPE